MGRTFLWHYAVCVSKTCLNKLIKFVNMLGVFLLSDEFSVVNLVIVCSFNRLSAFTLSSLFSRLLNILAQHFYPIFLGLLLLDYEFSPCIGGSGLSKGLSLFWNKIDVAQTFFNSSHYEKQSCLVNEGDKVALANC